MQLGIWPAKYALGEKYRAMLYAVEGYEEDSIRQKLRVYSENGYETDMQSYQLRGERAAKVWGASEASNNNALFGTPIDRSKENTDRMHMITVSMAKDTGKHDHTPHAYNPATVPLYILKNKNGTYVTLSGASTTDQEKARHYTDRAEIESHCLSTQEIVEV